MQPRHLAALACALAALGAGYAQAHDDENRASARLIGYQEVPAISSTGTGRFSARFFQGYFTYEISYSGLVAPATQSHIHFGQKSVNGGISVFLCSNLGNGPAGTQPCPPAGGSVSGTIRPADVIGPASQGISAGEFDELMRAIRAGLTYANVHSTTYPGGEIRGQIKADD